MCRYRIVHVVVCYVIAASEPNIIVCVSVLMTILIQFVNGHHLSKLKLFIQTTHVNKAENAKVNFRVNVIVNPVFQFLSQFSATSQDCRRQKLSIGP